MIFLWDEIAPAKHLDLKRYDGLELAGVVLDEQGNCDRVYEADPVLPTHISLYGHLEQGGTQWLGDVTYPADLRQLRVFASNLTAIHLNLLQHGVNDQTAGSW